MIPGLVLLTILMAGHLLNKYVRINRRCEYRQTELTRRFIKLREAK